MNKDYAEGTVPFDRPKSHRAQHPIGPEMRYILMVTNPHRITTEDTIRADVTEHVRKKSQTILELIRYAIALPDLSDSQRKTAALVVGTLATMVAGIDRLDPTRRTFLMIRAYTAKGGTYRERRFTDGFLPMAALSSPGVPSLSETDGAYIPANAKATEGIPPYFQTASDDPNTLELILRVMENAASGGSLSKFK